MDNALEIYNKQKKILENFKPTTKDLNELSNLFKINRFYINYIITKKENIINDPIEIIKECNKLYNNFLIKKEIAKKSKKLNQFKKEYKNYKSEYSMGEEILIEYTDGIIKEKEIIQDNKKQYSKSSKYRGQERYGYAILEVKIGENKNKYNIYTRKKYER